MLFLSRGWNSAATTVSAEHCNKVHDDGQFKEVTEMRLEWFDLHVEDMFQYDTIEKAVHSSWIIILTFFGQIIVYCPDYLSEMFLSLSYQYNN